MNPLRGSGKISYDGKELVAGNQKISNYDAWLKRIMHSNLIFDNIANDLWYTSFNRYGWINLFDYEQPTREYVFITKPDMYFCDGQSFENADLTSACSGSPLLLDIFKRKKRILLELQYWIPNQDKVRDPFMHLISNHITSKMDIPGLSAESHKSTPNNYGAGIDYRTHSLRSDYAFDFALSVKDTPTLDIYLLVKAYDEYMRMLRLGEILTYNSTTTNDVQKLGKGYYRSSLDHYRDYIIDKIIPEQFSVYKFIVGSDGETLLYWAKATGVYFVDVPRGEFSDPPMDGFKYSLSMHANFVEDMDPLILYDFNTITPAQSSNLSHYLPVYAGDGMINNETAKYARIFKIGGDNRSMRRGVPYDYRLKWTNRTD